MKHFYILTIILAFSFSLVYHHVSHASLIKSTELQEICSQIEKGQSGEEFDRALAAKCQGYLAGFFDTMIILEQMRKQAFFCIPEALPKDQTARILESWNKANKPIAHKTTASVALLSAYQRAFPCPKKKSPQEIEKEKEDDDGSFFPF